jgi:hypothetical protein
MIPLARVLELDGQRAIARKSLGPGLLLEMLECRRRH